MGGGTPLSVSRTVMRFVPGACAWVGVHVNTPLVASIAALVGAPKSRLNVSACGGVFGSVAVFVIVNVINAKFVWSGIGARIGGRLLCRTVIVNVCAALNCGEPLSVTRTVIEFVPGLCANVGVQVNTPDAGSTAAPTGAPGSRLNVNVCAGIFASLAILVMVNVFDAYTV